MSKLVPFKPAILPVEANLPRVGVICSHPDRVDRLANSFLISPVLLSFYRGYKVYAGTYSDMRVFIAYVGIGAPSAAVLIEELIALGAEKIIRVGTNDNPSESADDQPCLVIDETFGTESLSGSASETAHLGLVDAVIKKSKELNINVLKSKSLHLDLYYHYLNPDKFAESPQKIKSVVTAAERRGAGVRDMESACLFYLGRLRKIQTASILHTILRHSVDQEYKNDRDLENEKLCGFLALEVLTRAEAL